jgi:hypothetical protein
MDERLDLSRMVACAVIHSRRVASVENGLRELQQGGADGTSAGRGRYARFAARTAGAGALNAHYDNHGYTCGAARAC